MKMQVHILRSLLILGVLSMFNCAFAQEGSFIAPGAEKSNEVSTNGLESEYYREITTEPEKREPKATVRHEESADNNEVPREHGPQTQDGKPQQPVKSTEKPAPKKNATPDNSPQETEEDESVLSFNFLYYMIQKFKFSDVIDQ